MDDLGFPEECVRRKVSVIGSELVENYTVYIIQITDGEHQWSVKHRYSDFHDLQEKLAADRLVEKQLLPPKKMMGKNSRSLVERRQRELEVYLQSLLLRFPNATPKALACFLHFDLYEMSGVASALAEALFHRGEELLVVGEVFSLRPLQLHSIWQQLRISSPCRSELHTDLGHILDFTCRLRYLKIQGSQGPVGTSNILERSLTFDLSIFKSLLHVEISECDSQQIHGLPCLRASLATCSIHHSTNTMMAILAPEAREFPQWEPESVDGGDPGSHVTAVIPLWKKLTTLDMSHNQITAIDASVKLVPKVEFLDLSHNQLKSVEHLQHLYNLVHLDLSFNALRVLESAHTRLGNIRTLSLAGNRLTQLDGLSKLYSLVNLDLSHNLLAQMEVVRSVAVLPCLERINLSNNQICIIPDYRTKVLAQFCHRASEVCLDGIVTTQKELDTVEVLKAIQKAKETKDKLTTSDQKTSEATSLSPAAIPPLSSFSAVSSSVQKSSGSSQEVKSREEVVMFPRLVCHVVSPASCLSPSPLAQIPPTAVCPSPLLSNQTHVHCFPGETTDIPSSTNLNETSTCPTLSSTCPTLSAQLLSSTCPTLSSTCPTLSYTCPTLSSTCPTLSSTCPTLSSTCHTLSSTCPTLSAQLLSLSSNKDFISQLSGRLGSTLRQQQQEEEEEEEKREGREPRCKQRDDGKDADLCTPRCSPASRDGYFEMGVNKVEPSSSPSTTPWPSAPHLLQEEPRVGGVLWPSPPRVSRVLWCFCVRVEEEVEQKVACLVLTDRLLGLFLTAAGSWTSDNTDQETGPAMEEVVSSLQTEFLLPYEEVLLPSTVLLPRSCMSLGIRSRPTRWYLFSEQQQLHQTRTTLAALLQTQDKTASGLPEDLEATPQPAKTPQLLFRTVLSSWEQEESQGVQGGYPAHLILHPPPSSPPSPTSLPHSHLTDILTGAGASPSRPSLLFLTRTHLCVMKVNYTALAEGERSSSDLHPPSSSSWSRVVRVPLGSVALHPRHRGGPSQQNIRGSHLVELILGQWRLQMVFPLAQDKVSFLGALSAVTASLEGLRTVALATMSHLYPDPSRTKLACCSLAWPGVDQDTRTSQDSSSCESSVLQKLGEENQPPPHLSLSLSPGLKLLAGLQGPALQAFFHSCIAQVEGEQVRQVVWLSVVLYRSPEAELTSCLLLSTKAIYFLLEDSASYLSHHSVWDIVEQRDQDLSPCICLSLRLCDLLSVNVGLFDQYFRVVGRGADQIVCCLSRDSYGTSRFLKELMSVLSLTRTHPEPEPAEQDFYSQFTSTGTGQMQNHELLHSSRVKFIYPSEEEMADLTFIVAERKSTASSSSHSFNILLYLLVFQVQISNPPTRADHAHTDGCPTPSPSLLPRTLILTASDLFLLDEDYVSYPLPDFAKEPPSRERYHMREARRIRDVERVLLGYQTYPQALTLVFDDLPGPDLLCHLTMDHFSARADPGMSGVAGGGATAGGGAMAEVQWCIFVPGADSRERLISLLARQWEALCSRELPLELTG